MGPPRVPPFSSPVNMFSGLVSMFSSLVKVFSSLVNMLSGLVNMFGILMPIRNRGVNMCNGVAKIGRRLMNMLTSLLNWFPKGIGPMGGGHLLPQGVEYIRTTINSSMATRTASATPFKMSGSRNAGFARSGSNRIINIVDATHDPRIRISSGK